MTKTDTRLPAFAPGPARQCTPSGGAGSTDANFTDMRTTATRLDAAGDDASDLRKAVGRITSSLPEKSALLSPGSAAKVAGKISGLMFNLTTLECRMEIIARELRWSAGVYETTDSVQRAILSAINVGTTPLRFDKDLAKDTMIGLLTHPPSLTDMLKGDFSSWGGTVNSMWGALQRDAMRDPALTDGLITWMNGIVGAFIRPKTLEGQAGWLLATGGLFGYFNDSEPLSVREMGKRHLPAKRRQLSDIVGGAADVEHRSGDDHSVVTVRRVVGSDGKGSWVVLIPGTKNWSPTTGHGPSDLTANLATMAGTKSSLYPAIKQALATAMKAEGVRPGSEPVLLAGHSQGGIVAARMAADKAFRTKYDVREVVTAGAPIDRIHVPKDVDVLSINNVHDAVPHLDGTAAPDAYNRVDVTCETPKSEHLDGLADAHDASGYARASDELTRDRPEIQIKDWYGRNDRFLNGSGTEYDFELRRP